MLTLWAGNGYNDQTAPPPSQRFCRMSLTDDSTSLRRAVAAVLIVSAMAGIAGRICGVGRVYEPWLTRPADADPKDDPRGLWRATRPEPWPTHGDNDRSRWATIRALVHEGTYAIGQRGEGTTPEGKPNDRGIITQDGWGTIDKVLHPERKEFYSSKPPLLPTLLAGEYWVLHRVLGWDITDVHQRWLVIPAILLTINVLPFGISLLLLARLAERHGMTDWGRCYVLAAGAFATFLTTFAVTLNNHNVAAWSAMFALYAAIRLWSEAEAPAWLFAMAGFFASFTATNELPAASFAVALGVLLLIRAPVRTLTIFVPAALIPLAGFLYTNYLAIGEWTPAYEKFGSEWYNYEGSYWKRLAEEPPKGIDAAGRMESRAVYAFHLLVGHHGIFSLTPVLLMSLVGMFAGLKFLRFSPEGAPAATNPQPGRGLGYASLLTLGVTAVVLGFYILALDEGKRNYGGWTSGPRWVFWMSPLWLVAMLPAADWLGKRRWGRLLALLFLGVSVLSVSYPQYSPWRHPWVYNVLENAGYVKY